MVLLTGSSDTRPIAAASPGCVSVTPPASGAGARGFTLLEVLVVVLIIGVVISIASLGFSRDAEDRLNTEARRFAALITLASQESVLQARQYAVSFDDRGYLFLVRDGEQWVEAEDRIFRRRTLPEGFRLDINIEGQTLDLAPDEPRDGTQGGQPGPRIYLLSSGEITPFELLLHHEDSREAYRVRGDIGGKIEIEA